jgi:hypothetical protein
MTALLYPAVARLRKEKVDWHRMRRKNLFRALCAAIAVLLGFPDFAATQTVVAFDPGQPAIAFGAGDLVAAFRQKGKAVAAARPDELSARADSLQVVITTTDAAMPDRPNTSGLRPGGYAIRRAPRGQRSLVWVIGADAPGAMYGALELAETVQLTGGLEDVADTLTNPHLSGRGIKFNIPLDARTPSYSDDSTSAQANIEAVWDMGFWTRFLDAMARDRYNLLSLWSLSPFPSIVKVDDYPRVALADVKKKTGPLWDATLQGRNMYDPSWTLETVKVMSIDDKIDFWRRVMQYAADRGIEVSLFTWNIFVYGTEGSGYGLTDAPGNETTKDYVRKSTRALFNTYPLLAGIGMTSGENMGNLDNAGKERWLWEAYGLGVKDAMADAKNPAGPHYRPNRVIHVIHRAHQASLTDITASFSQLPGYDGADSTLSFSFKYSQAHAHSSTKPLFIFQNNWFNTIPPGKKTWLTVRNDDMYYLRWGDPDFVRGYMTNLPDLSKIAGFYMGPDGYTWGRDYVSRDPGPSRELVIERMWYSFLLWGRLAYQPSLPNQRFERILAARYPGVSSEKLSTAWSAASKTLPLMTRFFWGSLDFMWYPEACWSSDGFVTVRNLIDPKYPPMKTDEDGETPHIQSIKAYVDGEAPAGRLTPLDVADRLEGHALAGLQNVEELKPGSSRELRQTIGDIKAMAWLGRYYAEKIRGAVALARSRRTPSRDDLENARRHLQRASSHWKEYAAIWSTQYLPQVLTRMGTGIVDIRAIQEAVDSEIPVAAGVGVRPGGR